jgi:hypothetical protein
MPILRKFWTVERDHRERQPNIPGVMAQETAQPLLPAGRGISALDLTGDGLRHLSPDRKNPLGNELAQ